MATPRKLDAVVDHVMEHARYMPDAPISPYYVRYPSPYAGKFFCAKDTDELVRQIMKYFHPRASMKGY